MGFIGVHFPQDPLSKDQSGSSDTSTPRPHHSKKLLLGMVGAPQGLASG